MKKCRSLCPILYVASLVVFVLTALLPLAVGAQGSAPVSVFLEDLTWPEMREVMKGGKYAVIVPTGGIEQNGPHMALGKHNTIVRYAAGEIASRLGFALAAPVVAYVPEGRISPPDGHMMFPGTISVTDETLAAVLEDAARSLKAHGFRLIAFIGDHGGSQAAQASVADALSQEWRNEGVRVLHVGDYYKNNGQLEWLKSEGESEENAAGHAALADTSELMAIDPGAVRAGLRGAYSKKDYPTVGAAGDSTKASAFYGKRLLGLKIEAAANQIRNAEASRP